MSRARDKLGHLEVRVRVQREPARTLTHSRTLTLTHSHTHTLTHAHTHTEFSVNLPPSVWNSGFGVQGLTMALKSALNPSALDIFMALKILAASI